MRISQHTPNISSGEIQNNWEGWEKSQPFFFGLIMQSSIHTIWRKPMSLFLGQKTVAKVMSAFTTAINDLNTVAENNDSIVSNLQVQQEAIAADMATARSEADHARSISAKLEALMESDS